MSLTKRERVERAIRFEAVDRVPLCGGYIMVEENIIGAYEHAREYSKGKYVGSREQKGSM